MTRTTSEKPNQTPIAVIAMGALFPGSDDEVAFWRNIVAGRDLITDIPPDFWRADDYYDPNPQTPDKTYSKRGGFLGSIPFDTLEFGIPPNTLSATDVVQLLSLVVAKRVLLEASNGDIQRLDREHTSVVMGFSAGTALLADLTARLHYPHWAKGLRDGGVPESEIPALCAKIAENFVGWQEASFPGLLGNVVSGRIANRFDLHGTNVTVDAACASALSAVDIAIGELARGRADLVLAGGADANSDIFSYMCFSKTPALSPTDDSRPFSAKADGMLVGQGIGIFALKRLADAERDGDHVYGVIRGVGTSSDGRNKSIYAPVSEGQARAIRRAYATAGYSADTVELVEAHGTGTKAGDAAEFGGLASVFREGRTSPACALGSVKSQIGHAKAAAGAAGLFKTIMALHEKVLPPSIKIEQPNPALRIDESPFYLNTIARPWIRDAEHPRRASVSSFGFGGTNFHLTAEEYVPNGEGRVAPHVRSVPTELVVMSAKDAATLAHDCAALIEAGGDLERIARRTQESFDPRAPMRLAICAANADDLAKKLAESIALLRDPARQTGGTITTPSGIELGAAPPIDGEVAFLFPGQGSQYVGMGADLAMAFGAARDVWDALGTVRFEGEAIHARTFPHPVFDDEAERVQEERLRATEWAQPSLGVTSLATLAVLRTLGVSATCAAGHSFGELTALAAAGVFAEASLVSMARARGEAMRDAARGAPGAMLAVIDTVANVEACLRELASSAVIANVNGPREIVVSGTTDAIDAVEAACAAAKVTTKRLAVATAFHSPLVAPAVPAFAASLAPLALERPAFDVFGNADASPYAGDPDDTRRRLAAQLASPVRFAPTIEAMHARGVRVFVEVGPGSVLTGLVSRILADRPVVAVSTDRRGSHGVTSLWRALGRLSVAGVPIRFASLWEGAREPAPVPTKTASTVMLRGTNYGKKYPTASDAPPKARTNGAINGNGATKPPTAAPRIAPPSPPPAPAAPAASPLGAASRPHHPASIPTHAALDVGAFPSDAWLRAYQEAERHTAEAHAAAQKAMADSHAAFLRSAEASLTALATIAGSGLAPALPRSIPSGVELHSNANGAPAQQNGSHVASVSALPATENVTNVASARATAAPAIDLPALLLAIVAEKTGYAASMLGMDMELEGDLGVDSIKRVEILAALRDRVPNLPEVNPADLAALKTLAQITAFIRARTPSANDVPAHAVPLAPAAEVDLPAVLLDIVAEKTGYAASMLGMDMELEGDLGVDSIKRVEILAALRDRVPNLPEVNPAMLAGLKTLAQITHFIHEQSANAVFAAARPRVKPSSDSGIVREVVALVPTAAPMTELPRLRRGFRTVVTEDGGGVAAALVEALARRGVVAERVSEVPPDARAVIFLGGLRDVASDEDAVAVDREALRAARAVASRLEVEEGVFVTVQDTGGDFGLSGRSGDRAWLGGIAALARTARREWRDVSVKAIDCAREGRSAAEVADALAAELFEGGTATDVGLGRSGRGVLAWRAAKSPAGAEGEARVGADSVIVASGGGRGVTAASLVALAREHQPKIALFGRSSLTEEPSYCVGVDDENELRRVIQAEASKAGNSLGPKAIRETARDILAVREVRATLAALASAGSKARYFAVDVQDGAAVEGALSAIRAEWGPITGLVHGAGVLADKLIAQQTDAQFDLVFGTKAGGLRTLLAAMKDDPLTWICLFSSFSAHAGNSGQVSYAMANEALNVVATREARARGEACLVRSIGWGPWEGGMVKAGLARHFKSMGIALIPLDEGARACVAECAGDPAEIVVSIGGRALGTSLADEKRPLGREVFAEASAS